MRRSLVSLSYTVLIPDVKSYCRLLEMFGHPLRAIVPGYVGVRNAKWVNSGNHTVLSYSVITLWFAIVKVSEEEAKGTWQRGLAYKVRYVQLSTRYFLCDNKIQGFGPSVKSAEGIDVAKVLNCLVGAYPIMYLLAQIQSLQEQPVNSAITVPMVFYILHFLAFVMRKLMHVRILCTPEWNSYFAGPE